MMNKRLIIMMLFAFSFYAQNTQSQETNGAKKGVLFIEEGFFGYKLYYPDSSGAKILGDSINSKSKSDKLLKSFYSFNKRYLNLELKGPVSYLLSLGYDKFRGKYILSALDSGPGLIDVYQGNFDLNKNLVLDNIESGTHFVDGSGVINHNRLTFKNLSKNSFTLLIELSQNKGKTWEFMAEYVFEK